MEWISVADRLPEYEQNVLAYCPSLTGNKINYGYLSCTNSSGHKYELWGVQGYYGVTHWMPLPEPPKEDL